MVKETHENTQDINDNAAVTTTGGKHVKFQLIDVNGNPIEMSQSEGEKLSAETQKNMWGQVAFAENTDLVFEDWNTYIADKRDGLAVPDSWNAKNSSYLRYTNPVFSGGESELATIDEPPFGKQKLNSGEAIASKQHKMQQQSHNGGAEIKQSRKQPKKHGKKRKKPKTKTGKKAKAEIDNDDYENSESNVSDSNYSPNVSDIDDTNYSPNDEAEGDIDCFEYDSVHEEEDSDINGVSRTKSTNTTKSTKKRTFQSTNTTKNSRKNTMNKNGKKVASIVRRRGGEVGDPIFNSGWTSALKRFKLFHFKYITWTENPTQDETLKEMIELPFIVLRLGKNLHKSRYHLKLNSKLPIFATPEKIKTIGGGDMPMSFMVNKPSKNLYPDRQEWKLSDDRQFKKTKSKNKHGEENEKKEAPVYAATLGEAIVCSELIFNEYGDEKTKNYWELVMYTGLRSLRYYNKVWDWRLSTETNNKYTSQSAERFAAMHIAYDMGCLAHVGFRRGLFKISRPWNGERSLYNFELFDPCASSCGGFKWRSFDKNIGDIHLLKHFGINKLSLS